MLNNFSSRGTGPAAVALCLLLQKTFCLHFFCAGSNKIENPRNSNGIWNSSSSECRVVMLPLYMVMWRRMLLNGVNSQTFQISNIFSTLTHLSTVSLFLCWLQQLHIMMTSYEVSWTITQAGAGEDGWGQWLGDSCNLTCRIIGHTVSLLLLLLTDQILSCHHMIFVYCRVVMKIWKK